MTENYFSTRCWVRHESPSILEITASMVREEFAPYGELGLCVCDALFRCFSQIDSRLYDQIVRFTWRHFIGPGFAVSVVFSPIFCEILIVTICSDAGFSGFLHPSQAAIMTDENYMQSARLRDQFIGAHIAYDITRCQMVRACFFSPRKIRIIYVCLSSTANPLVNVSFPAVFLYCCCWM